MAGRQTRKAQQQILDLLSEEKENLVLLPKDIMISLLQENTVFQGCSKFTGKNI